MIRETPAIYRTIRTTGDEALDLAARVTALEKRMDALAKSLDSLAEILKY
jgi:hypothetical protein